MVYFENLIIVFISIICNVNMVKMVYQITLKFDVLFL